MQTRKKFGEILVEAGVINETALRQALERQRISGWRLGKILETMGVISEKDIAVVLGQQHGYRTVKDLARHNFPPELLALVPAAKARELHVFPLKKDGSSLLLAMTNPLDIPAIDAISAATRLRVVPCVTTAREIDDAIRRHYDCVDIAIPQPVPTAPPGEGLVSCLIASGDAAERSQLTTILKGCGYHVETAAGTRETISLAMHIHPDLILVESGNPGIDPAAIQSALGKTALLIAYGAFQPQEEAAILDAGYVDYIGRPLAPERVTARFRRVLTLTGRERCPPCSNDKKAART